MQPRHSPESFKWVNGKNFANIAEACRGQIMLVILVWFRTQSEDPLFPLKPPAYKEQPLALKALQSRLNGFNRMSRCCKGLKFISSIELNRTLQFTKGKLDKIGRQLTVKQCPSIVPSRLSVIRVIVAMGCPCGMLSETDRETLRISPCMQLMNSSSLHIFTRCRGKTVIHTTYQDKHINNIQ